MAVIQLRATSRAIITVNPKANKITPTLLLSPFFINSTQAAPNDVPKNGIKIPFIASYNIIHLS